MCRRERQISFASFFSMPLLPPVKKKSLHPSNVTTSCNLKIGCVVTCRILVMITLKGLEGVISSSDVDPIIPDLKTVLVSLSSSPNELECFRSN